MTAESVRTYAVGMWSKMYEELAREQFNDRDKQPDVTFSRTYKGEEYLEIKTKWHVYRVWIDGTIESGDRE